MPAKKLASAPSDTPKSLKTYTRVLNTMKKDKKYKNKSYRDLQKLASKEYKKL